MIDAITPSVSGRSISLYCHATGEEPPRITWQYRNGTVISESDRGASSLTLDNVHAERLDRLDIECVASNSAGFARKTTRITTVGEYCTYVGTVVLNYLIVIPWPQGICLIYIYAQARGPQARGRRHIYQANPEWPWYK